MNGAALDFHRGEKAPDATESDPDAAESKI
jgi:hypothetical protein